MVELFHYFFFINNRNIKYSMKFELHTWNNIQENLISKSVALTVESSVHLF